MRKLKVYGWTGYRREYDKNGHHQTREIMAASSMAEVKRIVGRGALFNLCETGNTRELDAALARPRTVFWRGLNEHNAPYTEDANA